MKTKVFFDKRMSAESGGFSPSGSKPAKVVKDWNDLPISVKKFEPVTADDLLLAHSSCKRRREIVALGGRKVQRPA